MAKIIFYIMFSRRVRAVSVCVCFCSALSVNNFHNDFYVFVYLFIISVCH